MDPKYAGESAIEKLIQLIRDNFMNMNDEITNDVIDAICGGSTSTGDETETVIYTEITAAEVNAMFA